MIKIYNEISIDMNPESSSYGETLHEDSFEYEGPLMKMLGETGQALQNLDYGSASYVRHQTFPGGYLVETDKQFSQWVLVDRSHNILERKSGTDSGFTYDDAAEWAKEALPSGGWTGWEADGKTAEVAPDIDYGDFSQFLDPSGNVSDKQGMVDYLQKLPGMEGKTPSTIMGLMSSMPNLAVGQADLRQAKSKQQSDVYGLQSKLGGARQEMATSQGMAGVYNPTAGGLGGLDTKAAQGIYGELSATQAAGADSYGLEGAKEEELQNWLQTLIG